MKTKLNYKAALGPFIAKISRSSIIPRKDISIKQQDLQTLTSYTLLKPVSKTMLVPGSPRLWTPRKLPSKVPLDAGLFITDPNRHIFKSSPMEPLFRALFITSPTYDLTATTSSSSLNLVVDRRCLRILHNYVCERSKNPFRIDVEVPVKGVMVFSLWCKDTLGFSRAGGTGYGAEFEKRFTRGSPDDGGAVVHSRVVGYGIGGVRFLVRFQVDAYKEPDESDGSGLGLAHETGSIKTTTETEAETEIVDWAPYKGYPEATMKEMAPITTPTGFKIRHTGKFIHPSKIAELKTMPQNRTSAPTEVMQQLWLSRTPHLCIGIYDKEKMFSKVREIDVVAEGKMERWEAENEEGLKRLVRVVEMIAEIAEGVKGGKCVVLCGRRGDDLMVYSLQDGKYLGLPTDVVQKLVNAAKRGV